MTITARRIMVGCGIVALFGAQLSRAADAPPGRVTFTKDVLPILQENCQVCHQPAGANFGGMVAPMAFMTYEETRPWAKSIVKQTGARRMPPWDAAPEYNGVFKNQRTLTEGEIDTIARWVATGAQRGRPEDAPPPREQAVVVDGWKIGKPDLIVKMPQRHFVADDIADEYANFNSPIPLEDLPGDRWISAVEVKPGNPELVHHLRLDIIPPDGQSGSRAQDFDGRGSGRLAGVAPGVDPQVWPVGYGKLLRAGSTIRWNMHYHKEKGAGTGGWDQSYLGLIFHTEPVRFPISNLLTLRMDFDIPPRHPNWLVGTAVTIKKDILLTSLFPHMHLRGKTAEFTAFYPDGTRERLIYVPRYDFNWQTVYTYKELKPIPAGTRIEFKFTYDNSGGNSSNPDSEISVDWGMQTTDEMMAPWIYYVDQEPLSIETLEEGSVSQPAAAAGTQ